MRSVLRAGAVALALTLASCGGGAARGQAGGSATSDPLYMVESLDGVDGCDLLTRSEIEQAFGGTVSPGVGDETGHCVWDVGPHATLAGSGPGVVAVGGAPHRPTAQGVEDTYADMRHGLGADAVDVDGIGQSAYYVGGTGGYEPGTVTFHTGTDIIWLQASFHPVRPDTKEHLINLARDVARRL